MGVVSYLFSFSAGAVFGVYLAQTYNIPSLQSAVDFGTETYKKLEHQYKKSTDSSNNPDPPAAGGFKA